MFHLFCPRPTRKVKEERNAETLNENQIRNVVSYCNASFFKIFSEEGSLCVTRKQQNLPAGEF